MMTLFFVGIAVAAPYIDLAGWFSISEPAGPRQVVVLHETADSSWQWNALLLALRARVGEENKLYIYDDDANIGDGLKEVFRGQSLPAIAVLTMKGKVVHVGDMPSDIEDALALIKKHGG